MNLVATIILVSLGLIVGFFIGASSPRPFSIDVVTKITSSITTFFGLILGYFYYVARNNHDENQAKLSRKRHRYDALVGYLSLAEQNIFSLLNGTPTDDMGLLTARDVISNNFQDINLFLENNDDLLSFSKEEIDDFSRLYSLYDNNPLLSENSFEVYIKGLKEVSKEDVKAKFKNHLYKCKCTCVLKAEEQNKKKLYKTENN
ncbi:MAG: hypothetical protein HQK50_03970 [Oligoflexia bacterium]|nr:hypothetical protein [Oligoflexia bacterium]